VVWCDVICVAWYIDDINDGLMQQSRVKTDALITASSLRHRKSAVCTMRAVVQWCADTVTR
jgi:hypothetical protein